MVPELFASPFPLPPTVTAPPLVTHDARTHRDAVGPGDARLMKWSWDRHDQISSVPIVSSGEGPGGLKLGTCQTGQPGHGDTVRERERLISQSDSFFFSRPTAAPEARRCQFS